ncbi:unnamed protein product [Diatraea saccharalis]|uniref:Malonyl-CoA:ACP transacylase (MAT) domain-containing protein n=1 Tax=Diatraea saccharalis TaxID=40085 RepID=A0A9N9RFQ1_9NEOP|nr:unnamed protein product [Diatraea saccharalis]
MLRRCILCRTCAFRTPRTASRWQSGIASVDSNKTPLRRLLDDASGFGEIETKEPDLMWATEPYSVRPGESNSEKPRTNPKDTTVLLFPGQGSQTVGMGKHLQKIQAAQDLYELASSVVGWDVRRACLAGPADSAQRAVGVLVTSLAALERVREERPGALQRVRAAAGFSLGELAALVFAAALPLEGALRLALVRAAAERAAGRARRGGMLALWLAADARLAPLLRDARAHAAERAVAAPVCQVANYMYPGCKVVAGDLEALEYVERRGAEYGVRRAARVHAAGALHTPLMADAAAAVRAAAALVPARAPRLRVLSAADARPYADAAHVRRQMARLLTRPVRWEQTLHALYARPRTDRLPLTLVLGPGAALRATLRQVNARAWDASLQIDV